MNWQIGDRAIILYSPSGKSTGIHVQILSDLRPARNDSIGLRAGDLVHEIDGVDVMPAKTCVSKPEWLGPIPDDKHERFHTALISGKWSDCEFNPMVTVEIEQ